MVDRLVGFAHARVPGRRVDRVLFFKEPDSLLQRLQFTEHGRDQFRDSRMIRTKTLRLNKVSLTYTLRS